MKCPICGGKAKRLIAHREWEGFLWQCQRRVCQHVAFPGDPELGKGIPFTTKVGRANFFVEVLRDFYSKSLLDFGAPEDLIFLKKLKGVGKIPLLYGYSPTPISQAEGILTYSGEEKLPLFRVFFSTHTLEHIPIPELDRFRRLLSSSTDYIVEAPIYRLKWYGSLAVNGELRTSYHYQFFTFQSFKLFFTSLHLTPRFFMKKRGISNFVCCAVGGGIPYERFGSDYARV